MVDEVLSQNEIDALLSAITSGEMDAEELKKEDKEKKVRVYDFKRALRFSKDQIRSISRIHENYARLLTTFFSAQLRTYINITVASVDQIPYEEFIRSVPKMTILNTYSVEPLEGRLVMEVNPNIAYAMLDRTLGGMGSGVNKVENLTEIETILMTQLFEKAITNLQEAWATIVDIDPVLEDFEVNPQFLQMVSPNETVVVVSLNTTIGEESGMINICIPHIVLEPIISKLSVHYWMQTSSKERDVDAYEKLTKNLQQAQIEVKALLGESTISIEQFLNLNKDDVIGLDNTIESPLILAVNDAPKFYVQPGKYKNKMSVQIMEEFKGGNEHGE
ncbi:MAG: flagellar motor switch protein FliM [Bacillota bacterium]|uniref:Flagellar motor switch protein FliM n=1 Tax=Virgibacillus salarius TaxID=447199 RepID=A0A941DQU4_9BACI|nr:MULTISPECIES: flagellar motor switch protein FliM [Bacillaceae]NAZ07580.1 flagellar motor switch protein FliM [Agaribacter marinus]MBR7794860.1 flagellar motor switch protein FliM [Virgibacillus salarius]MCC2249273.1 flagellar motor switch protein FliM [Virgibacillus sp. AGTR]MDY7043901.1 flagellar motor switch protein FliM [Virgibacillus sp. M23]QRZ17309.1 flagellar motor switch protein FliM [Virgibacillus sp. AGTR]